MLKKIFYIILIVSWGISNPLLYASTIGNKIKSAFKKEAKAIKAEASYLKKQAVGVPKNLKGAAIAFKKGNVKEGFKDIGKATYNASNLLTLGKVGMVKYAAQNVYKGAKEIKHGNKKGWKDMGKGIGMGTLAVVPVGGVASPLINFSAQGMSKIKK